MKLRQKQRISYYEPEQPNLDEYVFCDECADFVFEYCAIHGPLLVIPDDKVSSKPKYPSFVPRAALTIPSVFLHLAPSRIPGAGLGVFSTLTLPRGVRFGPYRGRRTNEINSMYCWQIYDGSNKPSHVVDAADANNSNWMRYVNCARHWTEQNLVAFQYRGQLYYRTIKIIPRFTELMVFYGSEFANKLHIDLRRYNSPVGYAQKFGVPPNKKSKLDENHNIKQSINTEVVIPDIPKVEKYKTNVKAKEGKIRQPTTEDKTLNSINNARNYEQFICNDCGKCFIDKVLLIKHVSEHKAVNVINIRRRNSLKTDNKLKDQIEKVSNKKCFSCGVCFKKFTTSSYLKIHLRIHTGENLFNCNICDRKCTTRSDLKIHLRIHTGEKPFKCNICDRKFTRRSGLKIHLRIHTGEKPFKCNICDRKFTQRGVLKTHLRIHTGDKLFNCNICDRKFTRRSGLKIHLRIHTEEKLFNCNICNKQFIQRSNLKTHLRIHTGERPYKCDICDKQFAYSNTLKSHLREHM